MNEPLHPEVAILNAALELQPEQRAGYLDAVCRADQTLRRQVEALLQAHGQVESFLEDPPTGLDPKRRPSLNTPATERPGDTIGRYKLLEQIGEGGCGAVYMAEQEEPVRRRVALKVIKLGMDTRNVIARFEAERQALAMMDHPNIAKVFDAGATETGRPFFVMELVRGVKITEFCDENNISTEGRLKLFVQVCQAIQHAHQKGVIHRDIKPSNILVMVNDGVPVPKVIDFGIAKATQGRLTNHTLFTAFEQFIGTPAYMSPEQAEMTSVDIDTRSDIYSLGVLLYELLTGRTPFEQKELFAAGLDEMRRTIREREPLTPSTRLSAMEADVLAETANHRRTDAPKLIHLLRGDLDWIVMKCIEKDRTRRYETANGLAMDIGRHLNNEPVSACPPSTLYRFRKAIRRNKLAFAAIGVLAIALTIVAVGSSIAAWRVSGARRAEQREREKSEAANRQLRQTVGLLELGRAEDRFDAQDAAAGVAHLAAMLRRDPSNQLAVNRLVSALVHRNWALPSAGARRHLGPVTTVSFSRDGRSVLSASRDNTAGVWEVATGAWLAAVRHTDRIHHASFGPDGSRFVTASADGTARVWNATNGSSLTPPLVHTNIVYWAEFSADGRRIATGSADRTARIWDAASGELKRVLRGHGSHVVMVRFSPDGQRIVTGGSHGSIRVWNADSGEMLFRVEDRNKPLTALAFSPDGRWLLSACTDGIARLWDASDGRPVARQLEHSRSIEHAAFSPDSRLVMTCSQDYTARLWEVATGIPVGQPLVHEGTVLFGTFSPDGQTVATASMDNSARLWDVRTGAPLGQPLRQHEGIFCVDFSPDGHSLVTGSYDWFVQIWDVRPRRAIDTTLQKERGVTSVSFSPDGEIVLTSSVDTTARLLNSHTGQQIGEPIHHSGRAHMAAFSRDGRQFVTTSTSRSAYVRDTATGAINAGPFQHTKGLWFAQFSPDGERLVTASADGTARVWNLRTSQAVTPPLSHAGEVRIAQFSPDGHRVVTASDDYTARVWDAQTGQPVTELLAHGDQVKWAEFSPDGEKVVTASTDNSACIWDARTGKRVTPPLQHARIVHKAIFNRDGRRVATISLDRTARIWDATTGQAVTPPLPHRNPLTELRYSPDGQRLLTGCGEGKLRIWDAETGRPLTEWLDGGSYISSASFDPSGQRVVSAANGVLVWEIPPAPTPLPGWFPAFAEAIAGIRLDDRGNVALVPRTELEQQAQRLASEDSGDFYQRLARWFLAEPSSRPANPF